MSVTPRDMLLAIKDQIRIATIRFSDGTMTAAEFRREVDLLGRAYQVLEAVATKSPAIDAKER